MRITILTAGTRGDTQPYVALGAGLQQAGYQVRLVAGKNFESFVTQYGLEFFPLHLDFSAMMNSEEAQAVLNANNPIKMLMLQAKATQTVNRMMGQTQNEIWIASQGADAILYSPGMPNGYFIAKQLGIPCIALNAVPMTPTRTQPAAFFYDGPRLGSAYNLLTHTILEQLFWQSFRPAIQKFWHEKAKTVSIPFAAPYRRQRAERLPILYGYSEAVLPRPADWPDYAFITGYWFAEEEPNWSPPTELVNFLQAGPPPVYIGFGSMGNPRKGSEVTEILVKALKLSGQRGLLATGWNGLSQEVQLPDTVFMVESVPHTWLFPQVSAVVHHGGAGTTAAGLSAGVPSIIVPHSVDQPMWGQRVAELGVGPPPIPRKELTAERLAQSITATKDKAIRIGAAALGQKICAEDGVTKAVEVLEKLLHP
ncbi:MAG: glycosyltransferase [Chloroflexota bacterium]|nr:glycosyltransferase family 1 protein [Chloroflexota bacterium]